MPVREGIPMTPRGHIGRRRIKTLGLLALPLAIAGWIGGGRNVRRAARRNLRWRYSRRPRVCSTRSRSRSRVTIFRRDRDRWRRRSAACKPRRASTIANPGADDCAGAAEIGKLVVVKSWQSNGEFDTKYTLPTSGQTFGKNTRFCDRSHRCALVVADANPDNPAYYIETKIVFTDQASTTHDDQAEDHDHEADERPQAGDDDDQPTTTTRPTTGRPAVRDVDDDCGNDDCRRRAPASVAAGATVTIRAAGERCDAEPAAADTPDADREPDSRARRARTRSGVHAARQRGEAGGWRSECAVDRGCGAIASGNGPEQLQLVLQSTLVVVRRRCIGVAAQPTDHRRVQPSRGRARARDVTARGVRSAPILRMPLTDPTRLRPASRVGGAIAGGPARRAPRRPAGIRRSRRPGARSFRVAADDLTSRA